MSQCETCGVNKEATLRSIKCIQAENAALKAELAQLEVAFKLAQKDCFNLTEKVIPNIKREHQETIAQQDEELAEAGRHAVFMTKAILAKDEQIAQQTEALRVKDEALKTVRHESVINRVPVYAIDKALAIQPSTDILKERDQRVAEACEAVLSAEIKNADSVGLNTAGLRIAKDRMARDWEKHL